MEIYLDYMLNVLEWKIPFQIFLLLLFQSFTSFAKRNCEGFSRCPSTQNKENCSQENMISESTFTQRAFSLDKEVSYFKCV